MREANPLSRNELQTFVETARGMAAGCRLAGCILPFTGLHAGEFYHLHRDWIRTPEPLNTDLQDADELFINVQDARCQGTLKFAEANKHKEGVSLTRSESSCRLCEPKPKWRPQFEHRHRTIPVTSEPAIEVLQWWFKEYESNPCFEGVARRIQRIAENASIDRSGNLTSFDLRDTFGVLLLQSGFEPSDIAEIMGYSRERLLKPLLEHTERSVEWPPSGYVPDEALLEEICRLAEALHRPPKHKEMAQRGAYSGQIYYNRFGGWNDALRAAGLDPKYKSKKHLSDKELLNDLRRLYDELGRLPSNEDIREMGHHAPSTYLRRFDGLSRARQLAGIED